VLNHLHKAGYKKKLDVWDPHELSEKNIIHRMNIYDALLKRYENEPFLKRVITSDEKWITYDNQKRKRSWRRDGEPSQAFANPGLTPNKMMLCVWWDWKGIVHHELLPVDQTINSQLYCGQLQRLRQAIERKRPELNNRKDGINHHDNARPHTSLMARQKLCEFGRVVLMHPPYSPDIAPSDYHLFRSLQNSLNGIKLVSQEVCENLLDSVFRKFFTDGIMALPAKWRNIVDNNGAYLV